MALDLIKGKTTAARPLDEAVVSAVRKVVDWFSTFGIRRVWTDIRFRLKRLVNPKKSAPRHD